MVACKLLMEPFGFFQGVGLNSIREWGSCQGGLCPSAVTSVSCVLRCVRGLDSRSNGTRSCSLKSSPKVRWFFIWVTELRFWMNIIKDSVTSFWIQSFDCSASVDAWNIIPLWKLKLILMPMIIDFFHLGLCSKVWFLFGVLVFFPRNCFLFPAGGWT